MQTAKFNSFLRFLMVSRSSLLFLNQTVRVLKRTIHQRRHADAHARFSCTMALPNSTVGVSGDADKPNAPKRTKPDCDKDPSAQNQVNTISPIREGLAELSTKAVASGEVFYNPVQEFNRDLSSAVLTVFARDYFNSKRKTDAETRAEKLVNDTESKPQVSEEAGERGVKNVAGISVLEALAASGFRSCRYAREVPGINTIIVNDLSTAAFQSIAENAAHNDVTDLIEPCNMDALKLMYKLYIDDRLMHAIDLDPYGTSGDFLEPALRAVRHDGGLLMITSTDSAVMCGQTPEVCMKRYLSMPLRTPAHHDMCVRILLSTISRRAATLDCYIEPVICLQEGFYVRVFVKVLHGPLESKDVVLNNAYVYSCSQCTSMSFQPLGARASPHKFVTSSISDLNSPPTSAGSGKCRHCNTAVRMGGPIWIGPLVEHAFARRVLAVLDEAGFYKSSSRIKAKLALLMNELPDVPLFYVISEMCKAVHCRVMPLKAARAALTNGGFHVSSSHCHREGIKTDAPQDFLWDMIRAWVKKYPVKPERIVGQPAEAILNCAARSNPPPYDIDFVERPKMTNDAAADVDATTKRTNSSDSNDADNTAVVVMNGIPRYPHNPQPHWGPKKRAKMKQPSSNAPAAPAPNNTTDF